MDKETRMRFLRKKAWRSNPAEPTRDKYGRIIKWGESKFDIYRNRNLPSYDYFDSRRENDHKTNENGMPSHSNSIPPNSVLSSYQAKIDISNSPPMREVPNDVNGQDFSRK